MTGHHCKNCEGVDPGSCLFNAEGQSAWCADCGRLMGPADEAPEVELSARGRLLLLVADKVTADGQSPREVVDQAQAQHYQATVRALTRKAYELAKGGASPLAIAEALEAMATKEGR
jgi:hypothetical protein